MSEETNAVVSTGRSESKGDLRASDGCIPGRRGLATRQKLLDATLTVLDTVAYSDLKVVDIARQGVPSPATCHPPPATHDPLQVNQGLRRLSFIS